MTWPRSRVEQPLVVKYRGLHVIVNGRCAVVVNSQTTRVEWRVWKQEYVRRMLGDIPEDLPRRRVTVRVMINAWWATQVELPVQLVSCDHIPWEIHAIEDPRARYEAWAAFSANV